MRSAPQTYKALSTNLAGPIPALTEHSSNVVGKKSGAMTLQAILLSQHRINLIYLRADCRDFTIGTVQSSLYLLRRSEFATTDTELIAIAAAANSGRKNPNAAIGMPMAL